MTTPQPIHLDAAGPQPALLADAIAALPGKDNVTASKIQRWLHVGYVTADRLVGLLEDNYLIGPFLRDGRTGHAILIGDAAAAQVAADLRQRADQARVEADRAAEARRRGARTLAAVKRVIADAQRAAARTVVAAERTTADVVLDVLTQPRFRTLAASAGYCPGDLTDLPALAVDLAEKGFYLTTELAAAVPVPGHNLRCNRCGSFGATWTEDATARPGWGRLALCAADTQEWDDEQRRHDQVLRSFRDGYRVNFEQPIPKLASRRRGYDDE